MRLVKGHGTMNDFLLARTDVDAPQVRAWCDRHAGFGADGLIVAATAAAAGYRSAADWFMDYRNADGSLAEMCGNGIRVFVAYLRHEGLIELAPGQEVVIATRGGDRTVRFDGGQTYTVDMGPAVFPGGALSRADGSDVAVDLDNYARLPGVRVDMPNPHTVVALPSRQELAAVQWRAVSYDPAPAAGTNLEVVVPGAITPQRGELTMRVLERGVGETYSCGTGCCAAAAAAALWAGDGAPRDWDVHVPGGTVQVRLGDTVLLTGPAVLVGEITAY